MAHSPDHPREVDAAVGRLAGDDGPDTAGILVWAYVAGRQLDVWLSEALADSGLSTDTSFATDASFATDPGHQEFLKGASTDKGQGRCCLINLQPGLLAQEFFLSFGFPQPGQGRSAVAGLVNAPALCSRCSRPGSRGRVGKP